MSQITDINLNGLDAINSTPIVAQNPIITWVLNAEPGFPAQVKYQLQLGTASTKQGTDQFSANVLDTGEVDSSANNYQIDHQIGLARGSTYYGQIKVTDDQGDSSVWFTFAFQVNSLPFITGYSLTPASPSSSDHIDLIYTFNDADGQSQTGTKIRWFRNNLPVVAYDDLCTLPSSATNPGEFWSTKIIPSDGIEFGHMVETTAVEISAADSNITSAQILPLDANVDDILKVEYTIQDDEYFSFTGTESVEWYINDNLSDLTGEYIRPTLNPGDIVYAIVKLSDGSSIISQRQTNSVVIEDVLWHIDDLTVSGLVEADNLTDLSPILEWTIYKSTASINEKPDYLRVLVTKTPSLDGPVYDSAIEYVKNSHVIPSGTLSRGQKYFIHIAVSDSTPIDENQYTIKEIRMAGSSWSENVSNERGWTIEFRGGIEVNGSDGEPLTQSDIDQLDYKPNFGLYVHDGTTFCAITIGLRSVTFLSDTSMTYTFGQRMSSTQITGASSGKTFKISGKGSNIRIFMNNELIIEGQGMLTNPSQLKMIEYGDIDGKHENSAVFKYFRYSTDGAFGLDDTLEDTDTYYFSKIGTVDGGSIEFIFGDFLSWTPEDTSESSKLLLFDEANEVTRLSTVNRNFSPITCIHIDEGRSKYIGTANGVTQISGEKHDPDYEFNTSSTDIEITPEDFDRMSNVPTSKLASVEPNYNIGWFTIDTTYRSLGEIQTDTGFYSGDPYDPYKFSIASHAIHYYSQRTHGHSWFDNVDNNKGWQVSFSFELENLESDDYEEQNLDKSGFGVYVNDGSRQEIIYFYEDRIRLYYANVYVPITTTTARDYVIAGKGDNLLIYQKIQSSSTANYSLVLNASGLFTTPASIGGNSRKPAVVEDSTGIQHAVWHDDGNGRSQILYSYFDGQDWSNPAAVTESLQFSMKNPSIAVDSKDRVWVAYEDTSWGQSEISVSVKDAGGWNPKTRITNIRSTKGWPDIIADSHDNMHLVWEDNRDGNYKIFWAEWSNALQSWNSSGQFGEDTPIMQFNSSDEYQADDVVDFKNPKLGHLYPYVYIVCEGHYQEKGTSAIYRGFRDLVDNFWNSSGAILKDDSGEFSGIGQPLRVSDGNRNAFNPSVAVTPTDRVYLISWEDRTEPISQIYSAAYYFNGLTRQAAQPITSQLSDCKNPSTGFWGGQGVVVFEKDNDLFLSSYNPSVNEYYASYFGDTDVQIDIGTKSAANPAVIPLSSSQTSLVLYDFSQPRSSTLSSKEYPDYQLIGDVTIDHEVTSEDVDPGPGENFVWTYTTTSLDNSTVSRVDSKEFAFGDFAESVGMRAHWRDIKMYFGYDAKPQTITNFNPDTVQDWPDPRINDLFVDAFGNLVAATFGGLIYYNKTTGQLLQIEGHTSSYAGSCSEEKCLLMTTDVGTGESKGLLTTAVAWGGNGVWYVGTTRGVVISQDAGRTWTSLDDTAEAGSSTIGEKIVNDIAVDRQGKAYIAAHEPDGSASYIYIGAPGSTTSAITMESIVKVIEVDENNIIWAGTDTGLWRVESSRNKMKFDRSSGMRSAHVNDITIVDKHLRYVATASGVEKMNGTKFVNINVDTHDLVNNNVNSVLWDRNTNSLWVGALYTLHEIVFRDKAHDIISDEIVHYDNSEISTEQLYDKNIYYIIEPDAIETGSINSESASVYINRNKLDFGYVVSESSIFFLTDLLVNDQVEVEISERFSEFHDFNQKAIERAVLGEKRTVVTKVGKTSQDQFLFLSQADNNAVLLYSGESSLPFTTITLDTRPPEGCIEQIETLSRTKIRFRVYATDDLSGIDGYMLSNYPNFTTDGETPQDFLPIKSIVEHDIGEGINNVFDSLSFPSTATIGTTTYDVGTGAALATWFDERTSINYLFAATSSPVVIFRYDPEEDEWTAVQAIDSIDTNRVVTGMKNVNNTIYLTTGSSTAGAEGNIWRCTDGIAEMPFGLMGGTAAAQYARGIAEGADQIVYFGASNGSIYQFKDNSLSLLYTNIGDSINDIDVFSNTMVVATGGQGRVYSINLETNDNLIIFDSSDTDIHEVHVKDADIVVSPDQAQLYAGTSDSTTIYRANMDAFDFVKSYSSFGKDIHLIDSVENSALSTEDTSTGTTAVAAVGENLFRHLNPAWEFFYRHDEDVNDFVQYETNGVEGIWVISDSKITKWTAQLTEKTVYLRLRDKAGNISSPPTTVDENGNPIVCPDEDANPAITCCQAYSLKIEDLADFVNEGRIVDVDSSGDVVYSYESPNNRVFYSADQIDQEVGIFTSEILNGSNDLVSWKSITWVGDEPIGTSINLQVRSGVTEDDVEDADWSANIVIGSSGVAQLEHITDQYLQFRVILTSQVRDLSPSLTSVTLSNITSQASHFFTTNFVLPSRPIKGLLTANTYIPVSSDIVFGINTKDSVDFGGYQVIEPNRLFTTTQGQFGSNLRIGAKLLSPGIPQLTPTSNPGDPYDASSFICVIQFDFDNLTASAKNYDFRIRFYSDPFRTQLVNTYFTSNDQTGWSYLGGPDNVFPSDGLEIGSGETKTIYFEPGATEVSTTSKLYLTIEEISTDGGSDFETILDNVSYICSACNVTQEAGLLAKYYCLTQINEMPNFSEHTPVATGVETMINFPTHSGAWKSTDPTVDLSLCNDNFAITFIGNIYCPVSGEYTFATESDDGSKLFINNNLVVDNDYLQPMTKRYGDSLDLNAGYHRIEVQYFESLFNQGLILYWTVPGEVETIVPAENLSRSTINEYCDAQLPQIFNFIAQFELENGETVKLNLIPPSS